MAGTVFGWVSKNVQVLKKSFSAAKDYGAFFNARYNF